MTIPSLRELHGVGPQLETSLGQLDIHTVQDLLFHLPLRYEDRTRIHPIGSLYPGAQAQKQQLSRGTRLRCYGEVRAGFQGLEMVHPSYKRILSEPDESVSDRLTPVYPSVDGLGQARWLRLSDQALALLEQKTLELEELLPSDLRGKLRMMSLEGAIRYIHRPPAGADVAALVERRHPAQQRLALEELLAHNLSMQQLHQRQRRFHAPVMGKPSELERDFIERLPFSLTGAQKRVIEEIHRDLALSHPMQRLVQGDVGSGKTVVAAMAAFRAMGNGYQTAITAPTELLAEQHLRSFTDWLEPIGMRPVWLSSKVTGKARLAALGAIREGVPLVIGTHALMQESVQFGRLGLVIVDEQHRFGVHQRLSLLDKASETSLHAHQLIMTATPIPRTLAMTAYAGLETSVIDELPPGRKPVTTAAISNDRRNEVIARVEAACAEGKQAYWVCTLIEESDAVQAQAAEDVATELQTGLSGINVGLIHGRMKAVDKQDVMSRFKQGEIQLLVATTVIEVGVDVPGASLMIIENAERLGLAQLHQLRGRVGRGKQQASCVLMYNPPIGPLARERLDILRKTSDGFRIAEKDLELRGPGEVLGTRQTGMLQFRVADLARDQHLLEQIPPVADRLLKENPGLAEKLVRRWIGDSTRFAVV